MGFNSNFAQQQIGRAMSEGGVKRGSASQEGAMSNVRSAPKADLLYPAQHGLEAQREAISRFAQAEGFCIFTEVETCKGADALRPATTTIRRCPPASALYGCRQRLNIHADPIAKAGGTLCTTSPKALARYT
jgi:hypothetical protein